MAASPSLSLSSQDKAVYQREMRRREEVSDECSSGVVRVVPSPHLMCVLCVQELADCQSQLESPSITAEERWRLQDEVQEYESHILTYKAGIAHCEKKIEEHEAAIASKTEKQGEPRARRHDNRCQAYQLPCQPSVLVPGRCCCRDNSVAMVTSASWPSANPENSL